MLMEGRMENPNGVSLSLHISPDLKNEICRITNGNDPYAHIGYCDCLRIQ